MTRAASAQSMQWSNDNNLLRSTGYFAESTLPLALERVFRWLEEVEGSHDVSAWVLASLKPPRPVDRNSKVPVRGCKRLRRRDEHGALTSFGFCSSFGFGEAAELETHGHRQISDVRAHQPLLP